FHSVAASAPRASPSSSRFALIPTFFLARAAPAQLQRSTTQQRERSERAPARQKQTNTSALRRQRLFRFQRNLNGSDSNLKCVHVRIVYTLTRPSFDPTF